MNSFSCRPGNPSSEFDFETDTESEDSKDETPDSYNGGDQQTQPEEEAHKTLERKQEQKEGQGMLIADLYVPSCIHNHRIVRGGRTPAQIQFLVEWLPGWTAD